jgi:hypothetical protein
MKRTIAGTMMLVAAISVLAAQTPSAWVTFKSPEGRYSATFPTAPKLSEQEATAKTGEKFPQYMAAAPDGENAFLIGHFDLLPALTLSLPDSRDGLVNGVKGVLISESAISLRGNPGTDLTVSAKSQGTDFLIRARIYRVNQRFYIIQAIFEKSAPNQAEKTFKFFEGFDLSS